MDVVDDAEGPLDPRIQVELENLNNATDEINKLEIELDEAHTAYRQLLSDSTRRLKEIASKLGTSCIEKARCYYEAVKVAREAQVQCQHQARLFQRASEIHAAAKETEALAEARYMSHQHEWNFDQAWQDTFNHATIKVMDAENQKAECAREHQRRATLFHDAEKKVQQLEEKYRRSIIKSRPYFEVRTQCDQMFATQKERVESLQKGVKNAKRAYASSLRALEEISNQIHQRRRDYDIVVNGPREPGVGAELVSPAESLNYEAELNKLSVSRINSLASSEPDMEDRAQDFEDIFELKQRVNQLNGRSVDGSESISSQWELELQASMEKLNNSSIRKTDFETDEENDTNLHEFKHRNDNDLSAIENKKEAANSSQHGPSQVERSLKNDQNGYKKLSSDFQLFKKPFIKADLLPYSQGWHSLTQSPINSILNKSKIALRNSISKSLSNSPVNMGTFNFGRGKGEGTQTTQQKSVEKQIPRQIIEDSEDEESQDIRKNKNLHNNVDSNEHEAVGKLETTEVVCPKKKVSIDESNVENIEFIETSSSCVEDRKDSKFEKNDSRQSPLRGIDDNECEKTKMEVDTLQRSIAETSRQCLHSTSTQVQRELNRKSSSYASHSMNSTPTKCRDSLLVTKTTEPLDNNSVDNFVVCPKFKKSNSKASSIKELPLLSMFETSAKRQMSRDKSCSMIDLVDKQNLKMLLDNSNLGNIQAVSVERLANARHNLVGDSSEQKHGYSKELDYK